MIKKILIGIAALIAIFLIVVATRPADFRVERSATLPASPVALFEQVNVMGKLFSLFIDCDKMCGPQFEKGLEALGTAAAGSSTRAL